jgi:hypothetical protein
MILQHCYLEFIGKPHKQQQSLSFFKALLSELWAMVHSLWLHQKEHLHGTSSATIAQFHRSQNCTSFCSTYNDVKQIATSLTTLCWTTRNLPHHLFETLSSSPHPSSNAVSMKLLICSEVTPKHLTHTGALITPPPELWDIIHPLVDHFKLKPD